MTDVTFRPPAGGLAPPDGVTEDEIRAIVAYAGLAPSVHNTQPWRFVASGHTLEIHVDPGRRLPYLDPAGRQLTISCGAAVECARLAVRALGRSCVVRLLPGGDDGAGPLATITIGRAQPVTAEEQRLIDAIPLRRTDRGPYDGEPVGDRVLRRVRDLVNARGCWLRVLDRPGDRVIAADLLERAEAIEASDPAYAEELAAWRRRRSAADGIPDAAVPEWDGPAVVSDMPLRDFSGHGRHPSPGGQEPPPRVEHDSVILVGSDEDSCLAWLRTGCAIGLAWLGLAADGISVQPLAPVTDVPVTRAWLRRELGLLGQPQLMFRIGRGTGTLHTGRRPVEEILQLAGNG